MKVTTISTEVTDDQEALLIKASLGAATNPMRHVQWEDNGEVEVPLSPGHANMFDDDEDDDNEEDEEDDDGVGEEEDKDKDKEPENEEPIAKRICSPKPVLPGFIAHHKMIGDEH